MAIAAPPATAILAGIVVVLAALRLHYGVDLTDEAYYAAMPYRFWLGDRPYVSELTVTQNAGLLTYPIVAAWNALTGSNDGVVLVLRYAYLAMRVALWVLAYRTITPLVDRRFSAVVTLLIPAYVFLGIPAPSYNTLAAGAMTLALLALLRWRRTGSTAWAGAVVAAAGAATFVHPGAAVAAIGAMVVLVWYSPSERALRRARAIVGAATALGLVLVAAALILKWDDLARLFSEARGFAGPFASLSRLAAMPARLIDLSRAGLPLAALWLSFWFIRWMAAPARLVAIVAYVGGAILSDTQAVVAWLALGAIPLTWATRRLGVNADLLPIAVLSLLTGVGVALLSTNGVINVAVGAEMAMIALFVSGCLLVNGPASRNGPFRVAIGALACLTIVRFGYAQARRVYRDDAVWRLDARVSSGPFRGLRTTRGKLAFIERVQTALRRHQGDACSLLAFNRFPAAHLMIPVRPALPVLWIADESVETQQGIRKRLASRVAGAARPILVLQVHRLPLTTSEVEAWKYTPGDPLVAAVADGRPDTLVSHPDFLLARIRIARAGHDCLSRDRPPQPQP